MPKKPLTEKRRQRIIDTAHKRQPDLAVILENVHDPHNISAVLRSCDAVGIQSVYVLYTDPKLIDRGLELGKKSSASARKWVDVYLYQDPEACFLDVREKYGRILASQIAKDAKPLYALDLTSPTALLFGNEHEGVSFEALAAADSSFSIPQMGMIKSLNISVACAVTLYEALRQRDGQGLYKSHPLKSKDYTDALIDDFIERHHARKKGKSVRKG